MEGENTIIVEAISAAGVTSAQTITVIGEGKGAAVLPEGESGTDADKSDKNESGDEDASDGQSGVMALLEKWTSAKWFPTAIAAAISVLVLLFFFVVLRDKKKKKTFIGRISSSMILCGLLELVLGLAYYRLYRFNNSLEYVELAQNSVQKASLYLTCEVYGKYVLLRVAGVIVLLALILLVAGGIKKLKDKKMQRTPEIDTENQES